MAEKVVRAFLVLALVPASVVLVHGGAPAAAAERAQASAPARPAASRPARIADAELFIEINATDGDAGLQLRLGATEWRQLTLRDPRGRELVEVEGEGRMRGYGMTDFFFESAEPPFDEVPFQRFLRRFPEGRYRFTGTTVGGRRLVGSDRLTHDIPAQPRVLVPTEGATVDPRNLIVRWEPVTSQAATRPPEITIVRYRVIVTEEDTERVLGIDLPASATSVAIPFEFLAAGTEYAVEVIARERSGNQTITEVSFSTAR